MEHKDLIIRPIENGEYLFLEEFFFQSLYVPEGSTPFPRSIIEEPHLSKYISYWGSRQDDLCFVALWQEEIIGAVWGRLFSAAEGAYGFVDEATPEIGIAVAEAFRGKGIGTQLIQKILDDYKLRNYKKVSLSVDKRNKAKTLYSKIGFKSVKEEDTAIVMSKDLKENT